MLVSSIRFANGTRTTLDCASEAWHPARRGILPGVQCESEFRQVRDQLGEYGERIGETREMVLVPAHASHTKTKHFLKKMLRFCSRGVCKPVELMKSAMTN